VDEAARWDAYKVNRLRAREDMAVTTPVPRMLALLNGFGLGAARDAWISGLVMRLYAFTAILCL
jgi:hypothetical protein